MSERGGKKKRPKLPSCCQREKNAHMLSRGEGKTVMHSNSVRPKKGKELFSEPREEGREGDAVIRKEKVVSQEKRGRNNSGPVGGGVPGQVPKKRKKGERGISRKKRGRRNRDILEKKKKRFSAQALNQEKSLTKRSFDREEEGDFLAGTESGCSGEKKRDTAKRNNRTSVPRKNECTEREENRVSSEEGIASSSKRGG